MKKTRPQTVLPSVIGLSFLFLTCSASCDRIAIYSNCNNDTTPPEISTIAPPDGAAHVSVNSSISIQFSEPMNRETTEAALSVFFTKGGEYRWCYKDTIIYFTPSQGLDPLSYYKISLAASAADLYGNRIGEERTCSFTTTDTADTTPPAEVGDADVMLEFNESTLNSYAHIRWTLPETADFSRVELWYKHNSVPERNADGGGTLLYVGNGTAFNHFDLPVTGALYYTIYSSDYVPNYSNGYELIIER